MKLISPYRDEGRWLRGSLHIHSAFSPCGWHSVEELALAYRDYDFLAVTDHDRLTTETGALSSKILLRGYEASSTRHMLLIEPSAETAAGENRFSIENYRRLARETAARGGLSVANHPARISGQSWSFDELKAVPELDGLEIFSGDGIHIEEDTAFPLWDRLLTANCCLWGFGNDDFHHWGQERRVWNVVRAASPTREAVLDALRRGDFYVSTGYGFESIEAAGSAIRFHLKRGSALFDDAYKYLTLYGSGGRVLAEQTGRFSEYTYRVRGDEGYVRAEVYMAGGYGGFSQPIRIES